MTDNNDVILSVYVPTYNHEKYIVRALDSILMQKTKYKFEVLVGEDKSTDATREVLMEYEKEHPGKFTVFYREQNMHKSVPNNAKDLKRRCKGKYIISLEGDDFWTDEYKLEKQIDFLENHPEYIAVAHDCVVVGEDSLPNGEEYPRCKDNEYSFKHFFSEIMPGQLATVMYHNDIVNDTFDSSILEKGLTPGDRLLYFALLCHGKVYCMQERMSAYRHITTHGSSFSATNKFDYASRKKWLCALIEYANNHCSKKEVKSAEYLLLNSILRGFLCKQITLKKAIHDYFELEYKISTVFIGVKRLINKKLLKKKIYA